MIELCGIECKNFELAMSLGFAIGTALDEHDIRFNHIIEHVRLDS